MARSPSKTPRSGRAQQARQALYRDLILEAAETTFADHGVDGSKMEEIAQAAGLSLGTVYSVFEGKAAILDALHATRLRELISAANESARNREAPLDMLVAGVRSYVEYFLTHPDYLRMYVAEGASWGTPAAGGGRAHRTAAWEEGIALQARLFRRGIEDGVFYDEEPSRMARTMAAMQQVRLADWVADEMAEDPDEVVGAIERQLRRSFCRRPSDRWDEPAEGDR